MQRLELRQGQALAMTPQLLQAIKLLQLSHLDLATYVEAEFERNPLLLQPDSGAAGPSSEGAPELSGRAVGVAFGEPGDRLAGAGPSADAVHAGPEPLQPTTPQAATAARPGQAGEADRGLDLASTLAKPIHLAEHLERQLEWATADIRDRAIGRHLIHSLDEAGYLAEDVSEIALRLGVSETRVERVLALLHTFDPPGVGARSLAECLTIQLREQDRLDPAMQALLTRLDLVAQRDLQALRRLCGVDDEDLADMLAEIRRLEPKPGLVFGSVSPAFTVPDVLVRPASDGSWLIELNPDTLPRILIDQSYYVRLTRSARSHQDRAFLSECLQSANWLKRSLDQRAKTILKVATEIVRQQEGFFRNGISHLRPLTLKTVADAIGMHESTVSRVTANKAMGTSRGLFEMKYFFTAALAGSAGADAHSSEAVRHRVKHLIEAEAPDDVLSDDAIAQKLKGEGIEIARRTVAKYRESLKIPSSSDRRRAKRA